MGIARRKFGHVNGNTILRFVNLNNGQCTVPKDMIAEQHLQCGAPGVRADGTA